MKPLFGLVGIGQVLFETDLRFRFAVVIPVAADVNFGCFHHLPPRATFSAQQPAPNSCIYISTVIWAVNPHKATDNGPQQSSLLTAVPDDLQTNYYCLFTRPHQMPKPDSALQSYLGEKQLSNSQDKAS